MLNVLVLTLLPLVTFACCPPTQWRGMAFVDYNNQGHPLQLSEGIVYNSNLNVVVANMTLPGNDGTETRQVVYQNYTADIQHVVHADGRCELMVLPIKIQWCIPNVHRVMTKSYIGAGSSKLSTTMYQYQEGNRLSYMTVADDGCIPMFYESSGENIKLAVEFMGIEASPLPDAYFKLPKSCLHQ